ncbi:MAG: preprotein translocase subunit SecG [Dehalococcoidia bacterium]|nr:preprotein translocase subunit SecG [Dehalococcoidia bacterium]
MNTAIAIPAMIIAILLITVTGLQSKGSGGGLTGGATTSFRTRRGAEKFLLRATIVLVIALVVLSLINFREFSS